MMMCTDNRFEIIEKAKKDILEGTNINTSPDEMKVLDNFLMRCWQMDWLKMYEQPKVGEWIPIGQYPSEPSLLCFEDGSMGVGYYEENDDVCVNTGDGYHYCTLAEPIAWMPLPPAYKGESQCWVIL